MLHRRRRPAGAGEARARFPQGAAQAPPLMIFAARPASALARAESGRRAGGGGSELDSEGAARPRAAGASGGRPCSPLGAQSLPPARGRAGEASGGGAGVGAGGGAAERPDSAPAAPVPVPAKPWGSSAQALAERRHARAGPGWRRRAGRRWRSVRYLQPRDSAALLLQFAQDSKAFSPASSLSRLPKITPT